MSGRRSPPAVSARLRFQELCRKHGTRHRAASDHALLDYGETMVAQELAKLPAAPSRGRGLDRRRRLSSDPIYCKVKVTVSDDELHLRLHRHLPQTQGPVNCSWTGLDSAVRMVFKALTDPHIPANEGCFRPMKIVCPDGTVFTARRPGAGFDLLGLDDLRRRPRLEGDGAEVSAAAGRRPLHERLRRRRPTPSTQTPVCRRSWSSRMPAAGARDRSGRRGRSGLYRRRRNLHPAARSDRGDLRHPGRSLRVQHRAGWRGQVSRRTRPDPRLPHPERRRAASSPPPSAATNSPRLGRRRRPERLAERGRDPIPPMDATRSRSARPRAIR